MSFDLCSRWKLMAVFRRSCENLRKFHDMAVCIAHKYNCIDPLWIHSFPSHMTQLIAFPPKGNWIDPTKSGLTSLDKKDTQGLCVSLSLTSSLPLPLHHLPPSDWGHAQGVQTSLAASLSSYSFSMHCGKSDHWFSAGNWIADNQLSVGTPLIWSTDFLWAKFVTQWFSLVIWHTH